MSRDSFYPLRVIPVDKDRLRAILRMLLDSGDITPMGARMIERILEAEDA